MAWGVSVSEKVSTCFKMVPLRSASAPIFSPLYPPSALYPLTLQHSPLSPWVVRISSLTSLFPILFSTSHRLFYAYQSCFLFPVPPYLILPLPLPNANPPCDLHFCGSIPVLVVCLVRFCFLGSVVDSYEYLVILLFMVFDLLFLR